MLTNGGNTIEGSFFGTNPGGTVLVGTGVDGVFIESPNNTVGGTSSTARNLIAGIFIEESSDNLVQWQSDRHGRQGTP